MTNGLVNTILFTARFSGRSLVRRLSKFEKRSIPSIRYSSFVILIALMSLCRSVHAQTNEADLGGLIDAAQQYAQENMDSDVLNALQNVDREKVEDFLNHYQD